jgi:hypothetical protein
MQDDHLGVQVEYNLWMGVTKYNLRYAILHEGSLGFPVEVFPTAIPEELTRRCPENRILYNTNGGIAAYPNDFASASFAFA